MNPNATAQAQERRDEFLRVLAATGSAVKARNAVGVTSRTVRKWQEDEAFLDGYNDAVEQARDEVVQKSRAMALEGNESQVSLWMKIAHTELRPASSVNVAVGVRTGAERRLAEMSDEDLLATGARIVADAQMRAILPAGAVIDADPVPASLPAPVGPENGPDEYIDPESIL